MKIIWRVQPIPVGRYRAFERRGWPIAWFNNIDGPPAAMLYCEDEYRPARVKTGEHAELKISVANHSLVKWRWRTLVKRAATLDEAKKIVEEFYRARPDWRPNEDEPDA